jgi:TPR repeat protein
VFINVIAVSAYAQPTSAPSEDSNAASLLEQAERVRELGAVPFDVPFHRTHQVVAERLYELACEAGSPRACSRLGHLIRRSETEPDFARATLLFDTACQAGDMMGCNALGVMQNLGEGTPIDHAAALVWYRFACENEYASACYNAGLEEEEGQGTAGDAAASWTRACDLGFVKGCFSLGLLHYNGVGVPQDYGRTHELFEQACEGGMEYSCLNLDFYVPASVREADTGVEFADLVYGTDYVMLGFASGGPTVIQNLFDNFRDTFATDVVGTPIDSIPMMEGVANLSHMELIIDLSTGWPGAREWVHFAFDQVGVPVALGLNTYLVSVMTPFYPHQTVGIVGGAEGLAQYESLLASAYPDHYGMAAEPLASLSLPAADPDAIELENPIVLAVFNRLEELPSRSRVLVSFDFNDWDRPQLGPVALLLMRHLALRRHRVYTMSLWETGQAELEAISNDLYPPPAVSETLETVPAPSPE